MAACVHATQTSVSLQDLRSNWSVLGKSGHLTLAVHGMQRHNFIGMRYLKRRTSIIGNCHWSSKTGAERTVCESQQLGLDVF
eukprot:2144518-Amphidinium_carterae.1